MANMELGTSERLQKRALIRDICRIPKLLQRANALNVPIERPSGRPNDRLQARTNCIFANLVQNNRGLSKTRERSLISRPSMCESSYGSGTLGPTVCKRAVRGLEGRRAGFRPHRCGHHKTRGMRIAIFKCGYAVRIPACRGASRHAGLASPPGWRDQMWLLLSTSRRRGRTGLQSERRKYRATAGRQHRRG